MVAILAPCLWIIAMLYSFYCQAIVCEEYFVPSLNVVIDRFKIPDDVAGATLMAMGTSSPELFCNIIAMFVTHTVDTGVGTIVGSDLFNMYMICGGSAIVGGVLVLDWTVLSREIIFYAVSIVLLYWALRDQIVTNFEAWTLVAAYVVYTIVCCVQDPLMKCIAPKFFAEHIEQAREPVVDYTLEDEKNNSSSPKIPRPRSPVEKLKALLLDDGSDAVVRHTSAPAVGAAHQHQEPFGAKSGYVTERAKFHLAGGHIWYRCYAVLIDELGSNPTFSRSKTYKMAQDYMGTGLQKKSSSWHAGQETTLHLGEHMDHFLQMSEHREEDIANIKSCEPEGDNEFLLYSRNAINPTVFKCDTSDERDDWVKKMSTVISRVESELGDDANKGCTIGHHLEHVKHDLWQLPSSLLGKIKWLIELPANLAFMYTIPDVKDPSLESYYWLAIIMFLVWLPILSYVMVTALTEVSNAWSLDPALMALTVGAVGTSFPDFFASLIVAKQGQGNMAVSNAFGSNIFNIFFASGFPWAVYLTVYPNSSDFKSTPAGDDHGIHIPSKHITVAVITLAGSLLMFLVIMIQQRFVLKPCTGWIFAFSWLAYVMYAVADEVQRKSA